MTTYDVRQDSTEGVAAAVSAVQRGALAVFATDTVYGVAADAFSPAAVARLLAAKGRGRDMPVPVLVGSEISISGLAEHVTDDARVLVEAFWPGPLTLIVRSAPSLAWDLGETRGTVAVRMPAHPVALSVLAETGPLAVSSANRSGMPAATTTADALRQLGEDVAVYLDSGSVESGVPSTILDLTDARPRLRRLGALTIEQLRTVLPHLEGSA